MCKYFTLFFFLSLNSFAQTYEVKGVVKDEQGNPIPFVNLVTNDNSLYGTSDKKGMFTISSAKKGAFIFSISALGYKTKKLPFTFPSSALKTIVLQESVENLDGVTVLSKSQSKRQNEQPIAITSLSTKKLESQGLGAEEILKQSSGVVVRQTGGLGSDISINLNGLTQNAVRIFYDGIPIEVFGGGLQINTIPVDALQRIDVYKGVMPVEIGTDALGGGVNLVPRSDTREYLRVSYLGGSFNTHRASLNGRKKLSEHISLGLTSFFNYSDNDYEMRNIETIVPTEFGVETTTIDARRFHDRHISGSAEVSLRVKDVSWTDNFEVGAGFFTRDDQIQNGIQLLNTAIGEATRTRTTLSAKVDYRKRFLNNKLSLRYYGVLATTNIKTNDSTNVTYNWAGNVIGPNGTGAEIAPFPTQRDANNLSIAQRLAVSYDLTPTTKITLSEFFRTTAIEGNDPVGPRLNIGGQIVDPNTVPSKLQQNVLGLQLEQRFFDEAFTAQAFYKNYNYLAETIDILQVNATEIPVREVSQNNNGYGMALKYEINDNWFVRTSYERALRMPEESEVFGNFAAIRPNFELRPEQSNNLNLGIDYSTYFNDDTYLNISINGFLREREDLIRLDDFGPESAVFVNEASVDGRGVEASLQVAPFKNLVLSGSFTKQTNEIASVAVDQDNGSIGAEVPNIPNLFFNLGASYKIPNLLKTKDNLEVFWNYFHVDQYSINEVQDIDTANPDFIIPTQRIHNTGMVYTFSETPLSISFNLNNVLNAEVFDNWRVPRPGINYTFKINYSIF